MSADETIVQGEEVSEQLPLNPKLEELMPTVTLVKEEVLYKMNSLVANTFFLIYKLQTLMILRLFKISTLLVFFMSQNQSQNFTSQNSKLNPTCV